MQFSNANFGKFSHLYINGGLFAQTAFIEGLFPPPTDFFLLDNSGDDLLDNSGDPLLTNEYP